MKKRIISALLAIYLLLQLTPCTPVGVSASSVQHDIYEFDGNYYQLFDVSIAWTEAMAYCESLGGHLVTITSVEEQAFIETLLESGEKKQYWIGMRFMENEYRWITGEIVGYTNWAPYQPDRCCYEGVYEDYIQIYNEAYGRNNPRYKWNDCYDDNYFRNDPSADFSRPENVGFICEWESKKAESSLVYLEDLVISNSARYTGNQGDSFINVLGTRNGKTDIHGNTMEHGLEAWIARWNFKNEVSWAWVEYALNGQYSVLSGKLTIISDCYNSTNFDSTIEIIGDGNILYSSALTPGMAVEDVQVDISGISTLRIYVYDNTSAKGGTSFGLWDFAVGDGKQCVHKWSAGTKTKEQTCTGYGEITYTCVLCGERKTDYLLPLGHDYVDGVCNRCGSDPSSSTTFNEYLYRASRLLDDNSDEAGYVAGLIAMDTPTELMVDLLQRNGFDDGAVAWTALTGIFDSLDDVTEIGEIQFEQQDMYSAIILSSLEASAEIAVADACESISKDAAALCQYLHDALKAADGIDIATSEDYKNLSDKGKERIKALLDAFFKEKYPNLPMLDDVLADFDRLLGAADCIETFTEQFYTYCELVNLSESMKDVLREMYALSQSGTNEYLQYALKDCVRIMETSSENMYSAWFVNEGLRISGRYALKEVVGALWDEVKKVTISYYPAIGILMVGYQGGKLISNWLCSSDSLVEQYYNMIATLKIENLAETAEASLRKKYTQQADVRSASAFIDSVDLLYGIFYEDCDAAYDFCDVVDNATLSQIKQLFGASDYSEVKTSILGLKDVMKDQQVLYQVMWIDALQDDWPELYEVYRHRLAEAIKPLKEKYREYLVACPVNVYVYDAVDNLVAYVIDGYPYSTDNVTVTVMGDDKRIHFYDDGEYRIVCEGYDNGNMDVSIIEYSDGGISREANFYDLEVTTGASYEMDTKADPTDSVAYTVFSDGNAEVTADYDSNLATNADKVQLSIKNGFLNTKEGPVFQISATAGERVNISACVPDGYRFIRWEVKEGLNCVDDLWDSVTIVRVGEQDIVINAILELNNPFNDVPEDSFYYTPVLWAVDEGITNGATETTFNPNGQCQRAQVVTFLWRAAGYPEPETAVNPFTDVKESDFYYKAVLWAVENGITNGLDTTHFGPFAYCNRAQVVTFLYRAMEQPEVGVTECPFTDVQDGAWYEIPVLWAVENGVTNGMDAVTFGVNTICNRAQVVTFLYRAFEK